jgi:hypothetical protein
MSATKFHFKVMGEGMVRARGELAFVLPQALDLVSKSSYVACLTEVAQVPAGVVRLRRSGEGIEAHYVPNINLIVPKPEPVWLSSITSLSQTLGRTITWQR